MPLFVYKCDNPSCGHQIEQLESSREHEIKQHSDRTCLRCTVGVMIPQVTAQTRLARQWSGEGRIRIK